MNIKRLYNKLFKHSNKELAMLKYNTINKWIDSCIDNEDIVFISPKKRYYIFTLRLLNVEHFIINNYNTIYNPDSLLFRIQDLLENKIIKKLFQYYEYK